MMFVLFYLKRDSQKKWIFNVFLLELIDVYIS
jgi:hypothetical protein